MRLQPRKQFLKRKYAVGPRASILPQHTSWRSMLGGECKGLFKCFAKGTVRKNVIMSARWAAAFSETRVQTTICFYFFNAWHFSSFGKHHKYLLVEGWRPSLSSFTCKPARSGFDFSHSVLSQRLFLKLSNTDGSSSS